MSIIKIDVERDPKTNTTEYHMQAHAKIRVPDEVIAVAKPGIERAIAERLAAEIITQVADGHFRFNVRIF